MSIKPYYEHGGITIYHGDCLELMPSVSAGLIVTDPPYFLPARHYATRKEWPRSLCDVSILEEFFRSWFRAAMAALSPDAVLYMFCDGQSYPVFYSLAYPHFKRAVPLVWDKQVSFSGYAWRHQHELILYAERDGSPAVPTGDGDILRCRAVKVDTRDHPAQKPVELLRRLVEKHPGAVLDPFAGSGATLLAAAQLGRAAVGIEREERYCEIAAKRLEQEVLPLEQPA
jgi:site-specific DNA-methyltransferase (adenine-specific)